VKLRHAKFQRSSARGTFSHFELNEKVVDSVENWPGHISETVRDKA